MRPLNQDESKLLFEIGVELYCICGKDSRVQSLSTQWSELLGWSQTDIIGNCPFDYIHPEDKQLATSLIGELAQTQEKGQVLSLETRLLHKDGSIRWLAWKIKYDDSQALYFATAIDTTAVKRGILLCESSNEAAQIGGWEVNLISGKTFWTKSSHQVLDVKLNSHQPDFRNLNFATAAHKSEYNLALSNLIQSGQLMDLEVLVVGSQGTNIPIRITGKPTFLNGKVISLYGTFQNLGPIRELESISQKDRSALSTLIRSLDDVVIEINDRFEYLSVWTSNKDRVWQDPSIIIGKTLRQVIGTEKAILFEDAITQVLKTGQPKNLEYPDPFVVDRWFSAKISPIENNRVCFLIRDVTEKVALDRQKKKTELALLQASKLAALGEMAGGVAHEINNPLTIILFTASKIHKLTQQMSADMGTVIADDVDRIEQTCYRIVRIVKGLSAFSRDAAKDPMEKTQASKIVEETLDLCRLKLRHKKIDIRATLNSEVFVDCRSTQIGQVLLNLVSNSVDAIQELPSPWIEIDLTQQGPNMIMSLTDSGPGIPPTISDRILEPFFTTKGVGKGTGLGLSISKGIIDDHHGSLWLDNASANTRFVVELPLKQLDP